MDKNVIMMDCLAQATRNLKHDGFSEMNLGILMGAGQAHSSALESEFQALTPAMQNSWCKGTKAGTGYNLIRESIKYGSGVRNLRR